MTVSLVLIRRYFFTLPKFNILDSIHKSSWQLLTSHLASYENPCFQIQILLNIHSHSCH